MRTIYTAYMDKWRIYLRTWQLEKALITHMRTCACFGMQAVGNRNDLVLRTHWFICIQWKSVYTLAFLHGEDVNNRDVGKFAPPTYHETCNETKKTIMNLSPEQSCTVGVAVRERCSKTRFWWFIADVLGIPKFRSTRQAGSLKDSNLSCFTTRLGM